MVETEDGQVHDGTAETEVNFRLPCGSDPRPELVLKDIPIVPGAVGVEADTTDPGQPRRLGPLGGAKPKRCTYELPTQRTPGPGRSLPGTGTQPLLIWRSCRENASTGFVAWQVLVLWATHCA